LLSGTLSAPLDAGDVVKVYANGTLIGTATVNAAGTAWEITDTSGYNAGWTYTAQVVDSQNATGPMATQVVNADLTEAAPVITGVFDTASSTTTIANNGTTTNTLSTVKGTGVAGDTVYLYDNNYTTLVGTAVVDSSGNWSVTSLTGTFGGSNTFAAKQVDVQGNQSNLSNQWTVTSKLIDSGENFLTGTFDTLNTTSVAPSVFNTSDFGTTTQFTVATRAELPNMAFVQIGSGVIQPLVRSTPVATPTKIGQISWYTDSATGNTGSDLPATFATLSSDKMLVGNAMGNKNQVDFYKETVSVVAGKTYEISLAYLTSGWNTTPLTLNIGGSNGLDIPLGLKGIGTPYNTTGRVTVTFTADTTGPIELNMFGNNAGAAGSGGGDYLVDNISFKEAVPVNTLSTGGPTINPDATLTYTSGALDALAGDDTITATSTGLQTTLAAGGMIDGGAGADTLKLAAGTVLNLDALDRTQTVRPVQEVEILQMQGTSSLTLSANNVLSLGGSNATTMAGYTFSTTTGGTASASSTGKVQMVITGTASDALVLSPLSQDGVTTNGIQGNTGLAGQWNDMGTTVIGGVTYKVYNHSTTQAQVLTTVTPTLLSNDIAFSSMTKDSGVTSGNANWTTSDSSAGRLVSGTISAPLNAGEVVNVYANGTLIGSATVAAGGKAWAITDTNGYNANWTYTAKVVDASNTSGPTATQVVTNDFVALGAPLITSVGTDAAFTTNIAHNGTTTDSTLVVKGTGKAGSYITLYDNSLSTIVKSDVLVGSNGEWVVDLTGTPLPNGVQNFYAKQSNTDGAASNLSNPYVVTINSTAPNLVVNGSFENDVLVAGNWANAVPLQGWVIEKGSIDLMTDTTTWGPLSPYGNQYIDVEGNSPAIISQQIKNLVVGQTYTWSFSYHFWGDDVGDFKLSGAATHTETFATKNTTGWVTKTGQFVASSDSVRLEFSSQNINGNSSIGYYLDNVILSPEYKAADGTLIAGSDSWANPNAVTYTSGVLSTMASNDTITVTDTGLQATLAAGGNIHGGSGVDTLKLAANTALNLDALTRNQTVQSIQQVEIFQLQGGSKLSLTANDVLSLGGANATTMSGFSFSSTSGGTGSASSTGKVQFVVNGTNTDTVNLAKLTSDSVTTNGVLGNTGLAGDWADMGTTDIGGVIYKVYNHSTTQAQVLVTNAAVNTPATQQAITITRADANNATGGFTEEFTAGTGTSAVNTLVKTLESTAWTIETRKFNEAGIYLSELGLRSGTVADTGATLGSDGRLQIGLNEPLGVSSTESRITTFTSKADNFTAISFKHNDLYHAWVNSPGYLGGGARIKFYDEKGVEIASTKLVVVTHSNVETFSYTLPSGLSANSFSIETLTNDRWFIDELTTTAAPDSFLPHTSATVDATPLLSGTYSSNLNVGDVVKVYDGSTLLDTATVDAASKTWTLQLTAAQAAGVHTYSAKVEAGATTVATSNNYTLNVLSNAVAPVVLDLNGDGQIGYSQIKMDLNRDGMLDTTAWVAAQDGLLMHDMYGDGSVRDNSQFAFARHGGETDLQGLAAQFDSNRDGVLDAKDSQFGEFAVWQDTDQDGVADAGEVKTLADLGITAFQLTSDGVQRTPETGVTEAGRTTAQLANGSTLVVADAAFDYTLSTAEVSVIPASEPGSMTPMTLQVNGAGTTIDLASFVAHNGNPDVVQVDLSGTGDNTLRLSLTDVLQQAKANGQALQIDGNAGDAVELFTQGTAPIQTSTSINGHDYAAYDLDRNGSMDLLVDQAVRVSLS
jgi:hypothetical protein